MIEPRTVQTGGDVAGHYDELDWVYREVWGEHVHHGLWRSGRETVAEATDALSDLVAERLAPVAGDHLADIGCGYGATAERLAARSGVQVTGFTLSEEQARVARARPGPLTFHVRDWNANGLPDGNFDHAYAIESTEHFPDKAILFREVARTLKPGGRFVVCAWLAADAPTPWQVRHLLEPICLEGRLPGMGDAADYRTLAEQAGLRLVHYEDVSRQVRRTWSIVLRRVLARTATTARYRRLLRNKASRNRVFALSVPRLILAYRSGAMRYGVFVFEKR